MKKIIDNQTDIDALADQVWDVVIAGAGPSGASAAITLADKGLHVLLLDKAAFPRDKTCGDGLTLATLAKLADFGLEEKVREKAFRIEKLIVKSPSAITAPVPGPFHVLKRRFFDCMMVEKAVEKGATFAKGEAVCFERQGDDILTCSIKGLDSPIKTHVGLIATGVDSTLVKRCGGASSKYPLGVAVRRYIESSATLDHMLVDFRRDLLPGYGWAFPMGNGEYNVGCGLFIDEKEPIPNLRESMDQFMNDNPPLRELLAKGSYTTPLKGATMKCGYREITFPDMPTLLTIGDAAGTTLFFTGEGIDMALESGEAAAKAIIEAFDSTQLSRLADHPRQEAERLSKIFKRYKWTQTMFGGGKRCDILIGIMSKWSLPQRYCSEILTGRKLPFSSPF